MLVISYHYIVTINWRMLLGAKDYIHYEVCPESKDTSRVGR